MASPAIAHLYRVLVPVTDIEQAQQFYSAVLGVPGTRVSVGRHYYNCGGTVLACIDPVAEQDATEFHPNPGHLYLSVANLEAVRDACAAAGARFDTEVLHGTEQALGDIHTRPWGERSFYLYDPFGNPLCFVDATTVFYWMNRQDHA